MHLLVELHGQPGWVAALTPLPVDGMIVAASTMVLAGSRSAGLRYRPGPCRIEQDRPELRSGRRRTAQVKEPDPLNARGRAQRVER
jgi:hypothetical protein